MGWFHIIILIIMIIMVRFVNVVQVNLYSVETGKKEHELDTKGLTLTSSQLHQSMIRIPMICVPMIHVAGKFTLSLAYSADGKYLASGAIDGIIAVFDMEQRKLLHTLEVNMNTILFLAVWHLR